MTKNEINIILNGVLNGIVPPQDINTEISYCAVNLINNPIWNQDQIFIADCILRISNFLYNNSSINVLPLDDGIYDQLLVIYKRYDPNYQVGAQPFIMPENVDGNASRFFQKKMFYVIILIKINLMYKIYYIKIMITSDQKIYAFISKIQ